jgi:phosphatidylserine decarboxylase
MIRLSDCWLLLLLSAVAAILAFPVYPASAIVPGLFFAFTVYFFRDPERTVPSGDGLILSPADGRVLDVVDVKDRFVGGARRLSIFMSLFNVHVNRSPFKGVVESVEHTPGRKIPAYLPGGLDSRERNRIEFTGSFKFAVEQYAGIIARRIVWSVREGQKVGAGERIGMIKYGSRVDVLMPLSVEVRVSKGDKVVAGETIIGVIDG